MKKRKKLEEKYLKKIDLNEISKEDNIILIHNHDIPEGVIGIIASRIKELFNKTCIILTKSSNFYKGSARSVNNFNIGEYIHDAVKNIIISGGGHNLAAGLLINKNKIKLFKNYLENIWKKKKRNITNNYTSKILLNSINNNFFNEINKFHPLEMKTQILFFY